MVCEDNELAPDIRELRYFSLNSSVGLHKLLQIRNDAHPVADVSSDTQSCSLFGAAQSARVRQANRIDQQVLKRKLREQPEVLDVPVTVDGEEHNIRVLRPLSNRDQLFVRYEAADIKYLLKVLRDEGFSDLKHRVPHAPNVFQRGDRFVAVHVDHAKRKKYKITETVQDAVMWQGEQGDSPPEVESGMHIDAMLHDTHGDSLYADAISELADGSVQGGAADDDACDGNEGAEHYM